MGNFQIPAKDMVPFDNFTNFTLTMQKRERKKGSFRVFLYTHAQFKPLINA